MRHDPFSEFVYAAALVLLTHVVPVVRTAIKLAWRSIRSPPVNIVEVPGSEVIGVLERLLFVYCFTANHREFVGAVLTFKAFSNWLIVQQANAPQAAAASTTATASSTRPDPTTERHELLGKFYTYAMGNFLSLMFAILFYELVHLWGMKVLPVLPLAPFYA